MIKNTKKSPPKKTVAERVNNVWKKKKKTGTEIKILTSNELLTRLPVLLVQVKAVNNS